MKLSAWFVKHPKYKLYSYLRPRGARYLSHKLLSEPGPEITAKTLKAGQDCGAMERLFVGPLVHSLGPTQLELIPDGLMGVSEDGNIIFVDRGTEQAAIERHGPAKTVTRLGSHQFLTPGFIDTHVHAPQYPNAGIFGKSTLLDWLETYTFPLEAKFDDVKVAEEVYSKVVARSLKNGVTTASYYGTVHVPASLVLASTCLKLGQRALVGRVCMERFAPENLRDASPEDDEQFIAHMRKLDPAGRLVRPCITPRFAPSCTESTLARLGHIARENNLPIQTHISENDKEIRWIAELFPDASSYADVYDKFGLLTSRTILAHAVHLTDEEIETVTARQCGIAHCPLSNSSIASGIAPIKTYLNRTDKIGLGTDVSGGSSLSVLENVRHALLYSRLLSQSRGDPGLVLSVAEGIYMGTLGGARVCGVDEQAGSFSAGKQFDAQLIDLSALDSPIDVFDWNLPEDKTSRLEQLLNKWVYIGDDRNTRQVWVAGKQVLLK